MIGTLLNGRYRLDGELGQGGMGVVYRAYDTLLERPVAVKVLSRAALGTEGRARLLREARAAAALNHPNIVSIHDAGEAEQVQGGVPLPFIVMELVEGDSLHACGPENMEEIVAVACQLCSALAHAHSHGLVHRDLKPENVICAPDGTAKLVDFGLARPMSSRLTSEGVLVGTVFYLAPELALGGDSDGRADLYSLGVMLYELCTGRLPFEADSPVAVISQHLNAPPVPPRARNETIPPGLEALILHLMGKDPVDRPATADQVLEALKAPEILSAEVAFRGELSLLERIERGRLVGRDKELRQAMALWYEVLAGHGRTLLISGEPGIGKSRFMRELMVAAAVQGGLTLLGASYAEGGVPYAPFTQILRRIFRQGLADDLELPGSLLADLVTLAPSLTLRFPDVKPNPVPDEPRMVQGQLFESMALFCSLLSERAPLLLALEDIHWADSGTLSLLRHLVRRGRSARIMIVATYREVELDQARPFHQVLLDLERERLIDRLKLPRLSREGTREMLAILFDDAITLEFLDGIYREAEGNPFFTEEVVKALVGSGKLTYAGGRWHKPSIDDLGIPQSVRVAIQSRLRTLPAGCQEILRMAAVLGREFDFDTLLESRDEAAGTNLVEVEEALIEALEDAQRAQFIESLGRENGGTYAFTHALFASTLVEGLRTLERRRLHRRAATAIEMLRPEDYEALARHFGEAGQDGKAVDYLLLAADRSRVLYSHVEAIESYEQAIQHLKVSGDLERAARASMQLGLTHHTAFDFKEARRAYDQGFALWARSAKTREGPPLPPAPHPYRMAGLLEPMTLDPAKEGQTNWIIGCLFSGLVRVGPDAGAEPELARSWEVLDGGRRYIFRLREDWFWSDGTLVTAADFEFAWKRVLDPATGAALPELLYDIKNAERYHRGKLSDPGAVGVRALDELNLLVDLEGPTGYFLPLLGTIVTFPVPRHMVEAYGQSWTEPDRQVINGPFRLADWRPGESVRLSRNPAYPGRFHGNLQEVLSVQSIGDRAARLKAYRAGELDLLALGEYTLDEHDHLLAQHPSEYGSVSSFTTLYASLDTRRPPFDDPRVRRAFVLATDRETLLDRIGRGYDAPATGGFVPPGVPGHSPGIGMPYDPDRARQLLAEAGYPDGRGFPETGAWTSSRNVSEQEQLVAAWRANLGVDVALKRMTPSEFADGLESNAPQLFFWGWAADYVDPDNFLRVGAATIRRRSGWQNPDYDRLVEDARRQTDQGERIKLYRQADKILIEEASIVPISYPRNQWLIKPWVRYPASAFGFFYLSDFVIDPH